jgi:hypothetical protein
MFQLTNQEVTNLKSQSVISSSHKGHGGRRHRNWAFTERGVAMLSTVLRSDTAVRMNIEIMRAFVRLRRAAIVSSKAMALVEDLSKRVDIHDAVITDIVEHGPPPLSRPVRQGGDFDFTYPITVTMEVAGIVIVNDPPVTGIAVSGVWFSVAEVR